MTGPGGEVTRLLDAWCGGDSRALEELAPLVETELRRIARLDLGRERQARRCSWARVNEALVRLIEWKGPDDDDRKCQIVELRFFGGLMAEETAEVLGVSLRTGDASSSGARAGAQLHGPADARGERARSSRNPPEG